VLASSRAIYGEGPYRCGVHGVVYPGGRTRARLEAGGWDPPCPRCPLPLQPLAAGRDTPARPVSVYGLTKRDQEELLLALLPTRGVEVVSLRLQNVYGRGQSLRNPYTGILSIFAVRLLGGDDVAVFEDGRESRDFVHVDDVVEAFRAAGSVTAESATAGAAALVVDVGSGRPTSVLDAARLVANACGADPGRVRVTGEFRLGDIRHAFCDPAAARAALDVAPRVSLEDGVRDLIAWVRESERPASRLDQALDEMRAAGLLGRAGAR
jgi:dTDP-L-rhamnose 4-epimerase